MLNTYTKIVSLFHWFSQNFVFYIHWIFFHIFFKITFISFFIEFYIYCSSCLFDEFLKLHFDISSTLSDTVLDSTFNLISLMYMLCTLLLCFLHIVLGLASFDFYTEFEFHLNCALLIWVFMMYLMVSESGFCHLDLKFWSFIICSSCERKEVKYRIPKPMNGAI